ncbi:acid protease [Amniculicola lignicola CBS 123094]|uniref:Acid protease n=1 Tax=Amniculicola lignicola CBS 123094 TaxID=1392246 RepID=A0A6A5WZ82_9PLEO|nr:acid protease [Amniculicola lignicola CBS 123094]
MSNSTAPAPVAFSSSQKFLGNDGKWSTFVVRVGTPEQNFEVLPASGMGEILVPHVQGCDESDPSDCGKRRGVFLFGGEQSKGLQQNRSSTWALIGLFDLGLRSDLGYNVNASYGRDTVGLMIQNSGGPTVENATIASIASKKFYTGLFGLGLQPANFTDFAYPQPSLMRKLRDENRIPSLSYGYTAGAYYKVPKVLGSLTLGGYDASRFEVNNMKFPFDPDDSRPLSLKVQRISGVNESGRQPSTFTLLDLETTFQVDFAVPHLWLPLNTCDRFAERFGLIYEKNTGLYRVNETSHAALLEQNPKFTIGFGATSNPAERVNIELPYAAFDLEAEHPIYPNSTRYFPIRRANETSKYTLGRTFMQEAYIITDFERGHFSLHQAQFPETTAKQQIIPILPPDILSNSTTNIPKASGQKGLGSGPIAGITVGVAIVLMACLVLLLILYRRHRAIAQNQDKGEPYAWMPELHDTEKEKPEIQGEGVHEMKGNDIEMAGVPLCELEGNGLELDGTNLEEILGEEVGNRDERHGEQVDGTHSRVD